MCVPSFRLCAGCPGALDTGSDYVCDFFVLATGSDYITSDVGFWALVCNTARIFDRAFGSAAAVPLCGPNGGGNVCR